MTTWEDKNAADFSAANQRPPSAGQSAGEGVVTVRLRPFQDRTGAGLRELRRQRIAAAQTRGRELAKLVKLWREKNPLDKKS